MARPSPARRISALAVAVTLLLSMQLLLLQAPVASARGAVFRRPPANRQQLGTIPARKPATQGPRDLLRRLKRGGRNNGEQLGSAAADDAGHVVLYNVSVGQQQSFSGIVNILDDFVWVQCPPAPAPAIAKLPCVSQTCQSTLDITADDCRANGTTIADCEYVIVYVSGNATGYLADETFTLVGAEPVVAGPLVFGCNYQSTVSLDGESGLLGFSRGNLSLISQLNISRFSYLLAPDDSNTPDSKSTVLLGDAAMPQTKSSRSTPLLRSNAYPELYYVKLTSIRVDGVALSGIPTGAFDLAADGNSGGVVMSTTDQITYLQADAYRALKQALMSKIGAQAVNSSALGGGVFDLCYTMQSVAALTFPKLTLVFDGGYTPTIDLTTVHYFYKNNVTGLQCLTMLPTPTGTPFGSVLGSMVQAGTNMIYDIGGGQLIFEKGAAVPAPSKASIMVIASLLLAWVLLF